MANSLRVASVEDGKEEGGKNSCYVAAKERSEMFLRSPPLLGDSSLICVLKHDQLC